MKFAIIIFKYFPFGGMQRDMLRTANALMARGHQVEVFTLNWQGEKPADLVVHELPQKSVFNFKRYQLFIDATFAKIQAQHFDYIFGYNRMAGLDAHFAADPCFIERAHQQKTFLHRLMPRYRWFSACEKAIFSKASSTEILAVSLAEMPHFQKWYGTQTNRFHYIPPYLSEARFALQAKKTMRSFLRNTFNFAEDAFVYLLTGSGFAMKGLDRAILALAALPETLRENTKLVAVGQDNPKKFQKMVDRLGLTQQVVISKGRPDTPELMQGADVCVHPAYRENTGLVILEGMASQTPMLVTESCGYAQYVAEAQAGLVCPSPFNQQQFNAQFLTMRESQEKSRWAENGLRLAKRLMQENDGSAEADILIKLAQAKQHRND
jgi:UDP-glucose:(heptosyl)LPS alpha-1,3-glucosyltransferase